MLVSMPWHGHIYLRPHPLGKYLGQWFCLPTTMSADIMMLMGGTFDVPRQKMEGIVVGRKLPQSMKPPSVYPSQCSKQ